MSWHHVAWPPRGGGRFSTKRALPGFTDASVDRDVALLWTNRIAEGGRGRGEGGRGGGGGGERERETVPDCVCVCETSGMWFIGWNVVSVLLQGLNLV
jgi:hypothetical protein